MMRSAPRVSFYQQIDANRRRSWLLIVAVVALLALLGFAIGFAVTGSLSGAYVAIALAVALAVVLSLGSYFAGDSLVLAVARAKPRPAR